MAASPRPSPTALHDRAADDLRFIRETMQRAVAFTALSGFGFILVGLGAIATAATTSRIDSPTARLLLWLCDALLSVAVGSAMTAIKARRAGQFAWRGPLRKFAASLAPALVAGAALTAVLAGRGDFDDLPCDLPGREAALQAQPCGEAEPAAHRAADLAGDTDSGAGTSRIRSLLAALLLARFAAIPFRHPDGFDCLSL